MIEEGLYDHIRAASGVTAIVGARIYALVLPQNATLPAITYQRISGPRHYAMGGTSVQSPRVQIDCWASTYNGARALAEAVRGALNFHTGAFGDETLLHAELVDDRDEYEDEMRIWRVSCDYVLWAEE